MFVRRDYEVTNLSFFSYGYHMKFQVEKTILKRPWYP